MTKTKTKSNIVEDSILNDLDELAEMRERIAENEEKHNRLRDKLLGPVLCKKLASLDDALSDHNTPILAEAKKLEEEIRVAVGRFGKTVHSDDFEARYIRPRVKWDADKLEGFALAHPPILGAKTVDEFGSCQIRPKKEKE